MPFPFVFHENFETGTAGGFSQGDPAVTDPSGRIDFPDWRDDLDIDPWRGGHVMRVDLNRTHGTAYVENTSALNIGAGTNRYIRFYLRVSEDFRAPDYVGASVRLLEFRSASGVEGGISISCSDSEIWGPKLAIWCPDEPPSGQHVDGLAFKRNVWLPIQVAVKHETTTGRIVLQLGENMIEVGRMAMDTLTGFRLGAIAQNEKIRGTLYYDDFIIDTEKLEQPVFLPQDQLWGHSQLYTMSSYAFIGPGTIRGATLVGNGAATAYLHDADRLPLAHHDIRGALKVAVAESKDTLMERIAFKRGCYIAMSGSDPQVIVHYGERGTPAEAA